MKKHLPLILAATIMLVVHIAVDPLLTVSTACSGARLFSILAGLGGGYWCGRQLRRWLILLPTVHWLKLRKEKHA